MFLEQPIQANNKQHQSPATLALCEWKSAVRGSFVSQMANNAEVCPCSNGFMCTAVTAYAFWMTRIEPTLIYNLAHSEWSLWVIYI